MTENEDKESNEENYEIEVIEDIVEEVIEEEDIYENSPEGLLISFEFDSNYPNSYTDEESTRSTQDAESNIYVKDEAKVINDKKSVALVNEED